MERTATAHLDALRLRLSHEKTRHANAKSIHERNLRAVWIAQIEKEIDREIDFLAGPTDEETVEELYAALSE